MFGFGDIFLVLLAAYKNGACRQYSLQVKDHLTELLEISLDTRKLVSTLKFWISDNSSDEMHIIFGDEINNVYNCIGIKLPRVSCAFKATACRMMP